MVVSDAHTGLIDATGATLPGAYWQCCRTHYARNLLPQVPNSAQLRVGHAAADRRQTARHRRHSGSDAAVLDALEAKFLRVAAHLDPARHDLLAFTAFSRELWRQICYNNPPERLNKEIRRRTDVVGIFLTPPP